MASTEENKAIIGRIWDEIVNGKKLQVADELIASDYVYQGAGGQTLVGPEGFKRFITSLYHIFSGLNVDVHRLIAEDDMVVSHWTMYGTHVESGREVSMAGMTITRLADGKMVEDWELWDRLGIAEQVSRGWIENKIVGSIADRMSKGLPRK